MPTKGEWERRMDANPRPSKVVRSDLDDELYKDETIARLEAENKSTTEAMELAVDATKDAMRRIARLEAERDALREAAKAVIDDCEGHGVGIVASDLIDDLRAAIAETEADDGR